MVLDGHVQGIYSIAFSPNGYQIATGAGDDTIRIWDMRSLQAVYTIPAHRSNVSDIRFFRGTGTSILSSPQKDIEMEDADGDADVSHDKPPNSVSEQDAKYRCGLYFASAGYDGFVKLWSADDWQLLRTLTTDAGKVMSVDLSNDGKYLVSGTYNRNFQLYEPGSV